MAITSEFYTIDWAGTWKESTGSYFGGPTLIYSGGSTGYRTFITMPINDIKAKITASNVPVKVYMHLYNPSYFGFVRLGFHKISSFDTAGGIPAFNTTNSTWMLKAGANKVDITKSVITTNDFLDTFDKIVNIGNYLGMVIYANKTEKYNEAVGVQGIANDMRIEIEGDWEPIPPPQYMQKRENTGFYGLDISSFQTIEDPAKFFLQSPNFNYFRAYGSNHADGGDTKFTAYAALAREYGVPSGGYFFGTPRKPIGTATIQEEARAEADLFIAKLQAAYGIGYYGDLTPQLDIEEYRDLRTGTDGYPKASGMTAAELVEWILEFRSYFIAQTGRTVGFYSNRYFLTDSTQMTLTAPQLELLSVMPLWLAEYDRFFPTNPDTGPTLLGGWSQYNAWQYEVIDDAATYGLAAGEVDHDYTSDLALITQPKQPRDTVVRQTNNTEIIVSYLEPRDDEYYTGADIYVDGVWVVFSPIGINSQTIAVTTPIGSQVRVMVVSKNIWEDTNRGPTITHIMYNTGGTQPPPIPQEPTYPLNERDVKAMLEFKKGFREIKFRYFLLDKNDKKIRELPNVLSGEVSMNAFNAIRRTAKFTIREDENVKINYFSDRIQPFVDLKMPDKWVMNSAGKRTLMKGKWIEFSLGIFILSSPTRREKGEYIYRDIDAYDKRVILEEDKLTLRSGYAKGTKYTDNIMAILNNAGITKYKIKSSPITLTTNIEYEPGIPRSKIINEFLYAINYRPLYVDEYGYFVCEQYISPEALPEDYRYEVDEFSVISIGMEEDLDYFSVPNSWVAFYSNADSVKDGVTPVTLRSTYINSNPDSPTSTVSRGRTIVDYRKIDYVGNQTALDNYVRRVAFETSQLYGKVKFSTAIMPFHGFESILYLNNEQFGIDGNYLESAWSLRLEAGALMTHEARKITPI